MCGILSGQDSDLAFRGGWLILQGNYQTQIKYYDITVW